MYRLRILIMQKNWTEFYDFTSIKTGEIISAKIYIMKAASIYYFGFEESKKESIIYDCLEQLCQDMTLKYKSRPDNYFFFFWDPKYKNRGVEQIELEWEGPILSKSMDIHKFCEYSRNPFFF